MNMHGKIAGIACLATLVLCTGCGVGSDKNRPTPKQSVEEIRAAIKAWQKDRWNADLIDKAKKAKGRVSAADLKIEAQYKDLQPTFDLLVGDYVVYVNVLDSFVDASNVGEAVSQLMKAVTFEDAIKMAKDIANAMEGAKSIKDKAGFGDIVSIGKDFKTISTVSASMTNASGILKSIFDNVVKK